MNTPTLASISHALALTEVFISMSAEIGLARIVHERDVVQTDLHGNTQVATAYAGARGRVLIRQPQFVFPLRSLEGTGVYPISGIHVPDLMVRTDPSLDGHARFALHEVELTKKSPRRVKELLVAASSPYLAPHIESITYWVCADGVERLVRRCAKTSGVHVEIRRFEHPIPDLLWRP